MQIRGCAVGAANRRQSTWELIQENGCEREFNTISKKRGTSVDGIARGDANTKYFHVVANGKNRKTRIYKLQDGDKVISGDVELKNHITSYYKSLFGPLDESSIKLDESRTDDITCISQ